MTDARAAEVRRLIDGLRQVPEQQWLELIGLREPGHPADVIGPLQDLIELGIE